MKKDKTKLNITISTEEGAIIFKEGLNDQFIVPDEDCVSYSADRSRSLIGYYLYAIERSDWIKEFENFVVALEKKEKKKKSSNPDLKLV